MKALDSKLTILHTAKTLVQRRICAGSSELSLDAYILRFIFSCRGSDNDCCRILILGVCYNVSFLKSSESQLLALSNNTTQVSDYKCTNHNLSVMFDTEIVLKGVNQGHELVLIKACLETV